MNFTCTVIHTKPETIPHFKNRKRPLFLICFTPSPAKFKETKNIVHNG